MENLYVNHDMEKTAGLANLCLLASIGLCPPSQELAQGLCDGSYFYDFADCLRVLAQEDIAYAARAYMGRDAEEVYHEINREYTRLFISPKRELVPLYEGLIVHPGEKVSMFISPTAMHCEQVYRRTGFAFEEKNKFPGDHVGIELRYFACLLARRAMALEAGNEEEIAATEAALIDFAEQHLSRWVDKFAGQVMMYTQSPFYALLADTLGKLAMQLK